MTAKANKIHIVAGPTASGKSARAVELAQALNGVVINADSMQIYDALPILTAQPTQEDKKSAPHKLYGVLHPREACSAGRWREMVEPVIEECFASGQTPIICGGTGLYLSALLDGLSPIPPVPLEIRDASTAKQKELGNPAFHAGLQKRDPAMAAKLNPSDSQRLIRAWAVLEATGKSLAEWQKETRLLPPAHWDFEIEKIMPERAELHRRCDARFLQMLENDALDEVKDFNARIESGEIPPNAAVMNALGYRPLTEFLDGKITKEEAILKSQIQTRQYLKRQSTWFRHQL